MADRKWKSKSGRSTGVATVVDRGGREGLAKSGKGKRVHNYGGRLGLSAWQHRKAGRHRKAGE